MNQAQTIEQLKTLQAQGCQIANVICDITGTGEEIPCYPKESFLVYLTSEPDNEDCIVGMNHWAICENISDFRKNVIFGLSAARKAYCNYYVSKVYCVKEFKSDFN